VSDLDRLQRERDHYARTVADLTARFDENVEALSLVRQVGDALGSSLDLRTVCGRTVDLLQEAVAPEHCSVMLVGAEGGLVCVAARGAFDDAAVTFEEVAEAVSFAAGEGICGAVVASGVAVCLHDARADPRFVERPASEVSPVSLLCLPLTARDRVVGVLNLSDSTEGAFEPRHERLLAIIANTVAMAVQNARLFAAVSRSREALASENRHLRRALGERFGFEGLIGTNAAFRRVIQLVEKVADTTANVLITGESGTGKEVIARTLHHNSPRADAPFVAINCAALPESLLEAELFGIERGVATGVDAREGTFERASGGTLFLDEIGDMDPSVQAKVLRVIQERQVLRVGGRRPQPVDVRLVAATHRDLPAEIAVGHFRQDLYYRLKVVTVHLPPLRERREDVVPLATYFLARFAARHGRPERPLGRAAARSLLSHRWPGNIRELEHAMEQAVLVAEGEEIEPHDLGLEVVDPSGLRVELPEAVDDFHEVMAELQLIAERRLLERALMEAAGNRTHAAKALGLARRTLLYKLKRHDLG